MPKQKRNRPVTVRFTPQQKALLAEAAAKRGVTLANWAHVALLAAAVPAVIPTNCGPECLQDLRQRLGA